MSSEGRSANRTWMLLTVRRLGMPHWGRFFMSGKFVKMYRVLRSRSCGLLARASLLPTTSCAMRRSVLTASSAQAPVVINQGCFASDWTNKHQPWQFGIQGYSTTINQELQGLTVGELKSVMDSAGIDYRDCLEKRELIKRLEDSSNFLPLHLKNQLAAMLQKRAPDTSAPSAPHNYMQNKGLLQEEQNTVSLFKRCAPSVVNITSLANARVNPYSMDVTQVPAGTGSGFVWDTEGHIVTNFHVIQKASKCLITFSNNVTCEASVVGTEPDKDLAVLKLSKKNPGHLFPIAVGNSQQLEVGQSVFAIGNPFGLDQTLTSGLVSGLGRQVKGVTGRVIRDVVQTDAAINPGNSGGPLLDSHGRLIGVNTMIYSPSGASAGVGFAIPSDTVRRVVNQLVRHGRVIRPSLGLFIFDDSIARQLGLEGVLVQSVVPGSGSDDAGLIGTSKHVTGQLILGDEIVAVGGVKISTKEDLIAAVETFSVGDMVTLGIRRGGEVRDTHIRLKHAAAE